MVSIDSSQCPHTHHANPLCEIKIVHSFEARRIKTLKSKFDGRLWFGSNLEGETVNWGGDQDRTTTTTTTKIWKLIFHCKSRCNESKMGFANSKPTLYILITCIPNKFDHSWIVAINCSTCTQTWNLNGEKEGNGLACCNLKDLESMVKIF